MHNIIFMIATKNKISLYTYTTLSGTHEGKDGDFFGGDPSRYLLNVKE